MLGLRFAACAAFPRTSAFRLLAVQSSRFVAPTGKHAYALGSRSFSAAAQTSDDSSEPAQPIGFPHRICAAVVLERYPMIMPDLSPFEQQYSEWAETMHIEKTKFSVVELMDVQEDAASAKEAAAQGGKAKKKEKKSKAAAAAEKAKKEKEAADQDGENDALLAAAREEAKEALKEKFVAADRVTDADRKNDKKSTTRALQNVLYLLVRELPRKGSGETAQWRFPQIERTGDETLRKTAERAARSGIDREGKMRTYFIANCPSVHFTTEHAPDASGFTGQKVFAFRAQWLEGPLSLAKRYSDYVWVKHDEVADYVTPEYYANVKGMLRS